MASSTPTYDPEDRLHQIVRDVAQENAGPSNTRPTYQDKRRKARNTKDMTRDLGTTTLNDSPSPESADDDEDDEDSDTPSDHGELLPVRVTLASGIDPVDFTDPHAVSINDISTVAKIRNMLDEEFTADLAVLKSPEEARVLAYRFKVVGYKETEEQEWTAVTTPAELKAVVKDLKERDWHWQIVRMQVCLVEGDEASEVGDRPHLLGKATVKKVKAGGQELRAGGEENLRRRSAIQETEQKEVEEDSEEEGEMVTITKDEFEEYQELKRRAGLAKEAEAEPDELEDTKALLEATEVDLKDVMYFLARSLETMAGIRGPRRAAEDGEGEEDNEVDPVVAAATGQTEPDMVQATRRVIHATRILAEMMGVTIPDAPA
jgi:hypothetical protein